MENSAEKDPTDLPMSFAQFGIEPDIVAALDEMGYDKVLEVQQATIPPLLAGRHLSMRAKTGSGKTAAFGIPMLQRLDPANTAPSLLVLAPTRELASQITAELTGIGKKKGIKVVAVYGGASIQGQIQALRDGVQVVVGTPGRLMDLASRKELNWKNFQSVVLDEADEMLSMGFFEDVSLIMDGCTACEQVVILSASLEGDTTRLIDTYTSDVVRIDLSSDRLSVEGIRNIYYVIGDELPRHHYLLYVLAQEKPNSAIVFVNTRKDASVVATLMAREGLQAEMLSGELPQKERERVMGAIRAGKLRYLVATDVAARGIDISDLTHVINFSLPEDPAIFLHRVGRTGRVDREGTAISLVSGLRLRTLGVLEREFGVAFEERKFPPPAQMRKDRSAGNIESLIKAAELAICDGFLDQSRAVLDHESAVQIVAYLLKRNGDQVHDEQRSSANRPQHGPPRRDSDKSRRPHSGKSRSSRPPRSSKPRRRG